MQLFHLEQTTISMEILPLYNLHKKIIANKNTIEQLKISNLPQLRQFSRKYETFGIVYQHLHNSRLEFCHGMKSPFSAYFVNCTMEIAFHFCYLFVDVCVGWKCKKSQL